MRKILVAVDGSVMADRAVVHAAGLARDIPGAHVLLLNVQPVLEHPRSGGLLNAEVRTELQALGEQAARQARTLLDEAGVVYEFDVVFGHPAEVIARVAREKACTEIVIGTRGFGDFQSGLMGSTAHRVIELSDLPVTLLK